MQCILVLWLFSPDTGKNITSITAEVIQKWKDDSGFKQFPILILSIAANPVRVKEIDISLVTKYFKPAKLFLYSFLLNHRSVDANRARCAVTSH